MRKLFEQITNLKKEYDEIRKKNKFNVITALHKERDEVNLHSRIISYLLCPTSGHGMGDLYLKIFVRDILQLNESQFDLNNISVVPNEINKTEYKEIDILLVNKLTSQAIIIENKIDAQDSNNMNNQYGYQGQLERYYSTITTGKDNHGKASEDFKSKYVHVYYLTMKNQPPSEVSIGILKNEPCSWSANHVLSYDSQIRDWLTKCLEISSKENSEVKSFIKHYSNLIDKMTNNDLPLDERLQLKDVVAENISSSKYLIDNFKHVKWHTVSDFWTQLKVQLEKRLETDSMYFPAESTDFNKTLTKVTHHGEGINHGLLFDINDTKAYISGFGKLSWGVVEPKKWTNFNHEKVAEINLSDFSSEYTFQLIDKSIMTEVIQIILTEIVNSASNNFENLKLSN